MKIFIKCADKSTSSICIEEVKAQVTETMRILKEEYSLDPDRFIIDGGVDMDDSALFPQFYQDDACAVQVRDKNNEHTFNLYSPRYTLMYVWEIDDIESQIDSENVAYQINSIDKYYRELQDVGTDGYLYLGRYDTLEDSIKIDIDNIV